MIQQERFQEFMKMNNESCLILSPDASLDGKSCTVYDAIALCVICSDASIIVGSHFAVANSEVGQGGTDRYLLVER